jgi:hypothetical protein
MVRPDNKGARRRYYRELRQNANPADPANPNNSPPANLNTTKSKATLHHPQQPSPNAKKQKQKQKNRETLER